MICPRPIFDLTEVADFDKTGEVVGCDGEKRNMTKQRNITKPSKSVIGFVRRKARGAIVKVLPVVPARFHLSAS